MDAFAQLVAALDAAPDSDAKAARLADYLRTAPTEDANRALALLRGQRTFPTVSIRRLRAWVERLTGTPSWLVEASRAHTGNLVEALALLLPEPAEPRSSTDSLHRFVVEFLQPMAAMDEIDRRDRIVERLRESNTTQRIALLKMVAGGNYLKLLDRIVRNATDSLAVTPLHTKVPAVAITVVAVLMYATRSAPNRAEPYAHYSFGVWRDRELVPVAKIPCEAIGHLRPALDAFIDKNTIQRHGPARIIPMTQVYELMCDGYESSVRHKAGVLLCAPKVVRHRPELPPEKAHTLDQLQSHKPSQPTN